MAGNVGLMDTAQVTAGQEHRAAHLARRVVREVEQLDVEVLARIDDGVGMPDLPLHMTGRHLMWAVVVVERIGTDQALDDTLYLRQSDHGADAPRFAPK